MPFDLESILLSNTTLFVSIIMIVTVWSSIWKGIALWRAGRNHHLAWFICIFIFNTVGILEIIYIFGFSRSRRSTPQWLPPDD